MKPLRLTKTVLKSIAQICLCESPITGALFLAAIATHSLTLAASAVFAVVVSISTAKVLRYEAGVTERGLHGFNGALVGIATFIFFPVSGGILVLMALATILATVMTEWARKKELPALTAPFCIATWVLILGAKVVSIVPLQEPTPPHLNIGFDLFGTITSVGQILFLTSPLAGAICIFALGADSVKTAGAATGAALAASLLGIATLFPQSAVEAGLVGYNAALCGIALQSRPLLGAVAIIGTIPLLSAFNALPVPPLTAPFVLTTAAALLFQRRLEQKSA